MFVKSIIGTVIAAVLCGCSSTPELPDTNGDAEAAKWLKMAAEEGNLYAQYYYAECCLAGDGVPADRAEAIRVLKLAAANGSIEASELLNKLASEKSSKSVN
ncbi:MAG: sel1 repeat family protein [Lentisphaerae bacterium]|nr:sel1 repeat family protein [Lentisphaerota bacterium]